jgi:hypothetical protein
MTKETSDLLTALNNLDEVMVDVMLGLLEDTLAAEQQVRFGGMFVQVGTLLQQRADLTPPTVAKSQAADRSGTVARST